MTPKQRHFPVLKKSAYCLLPILSWALGCDEDLPLDTAKGPPKKQKTKTNNSNNPKKQPTDSCIFFFF
jgi:hypothetical protein